MASEYTTKLYDMLDRIVFDRYGTHDDDLTLFVLAANPGLEREGLTLTPGLTIVLPDKPSAATTQLPTIGRIQLWS